MLRENIALDAKFWSSLIAYQQRLFPNVYQLVFNFSSTHRGTKSGPTLEAVWSVKHHFIPIHKLPPEWFDHSLHCMIWPITNNRSLQKPKLRQWGRKNGFPLFVIGGREEEVDSADVVRVLVAAEQSYLFWFYFLVFDFDFWFCIYTTTET